MSNHKSTQLLTEVADYYSAKLAEFGDSPRGVDWNGKEGQFLRFEQLARIIDERTSFSVNDLGCGYGALFEYLQSRYAKFTYQGCDVSGEMTRCASARYPSSANASFVIGAVPPGVADYGIASGIFNVRLGRSDAEWREHCESTLDVLNCTSRRGFAVNFLTSYSDLDRRQNYLYYADPCALFDFCKVRYSQHVALLHDYGLYEFSILVRKS